MNTETNPLYPSIVGPLDGLIQKIPRTRLVDGVVVRNLEPCELSRINDILGEGGRVGFGLGKLPEQAVCLEVKLPASAQTAREWNQHQTNVREVGGALIQRAVTLLRLAQAGPIGSRLAVAPLAESIPSGYTLVQIEFLPPIRHPQYPNVYALGPPVVEEIRRLFSSYWDTDIVTMPGVRWLSKSYLELNEDDRTAPISYLAWSSFC